MAATTVALPPQVMVVTEADRLANQLAHLHVTQFFQKFEDYLSHHGLNSALPA